MLLRKILFVALLTWFSLTVFGYGVYKALPIILGPSVEITSPQNGEVAQGTTLNLHGNVYRAKSLYINGIATAFTETGYFETRLPVYSGSNIILVEVRDRFGRSAKQTINVGTN